MKTDFEVEQTIKNLKETTEYLRTKGLPKKKSSGKTHKTKDSSEK